ncbi:Phosphatidylinositol 4-kinase stt4 [Rhodotorula kratochvilovae]
MGENLHQELLSALAANLASSSSQDDVALLAASFNAVNPASNQAVNGIAARLTAEPADDDRDSLTVDQLEGMVAFAQYTAAAPFEHAHLDQVLSLLDALPRWSLEPALGLQASSDLAPADALAFALTDAALRTANRERSAREPVLQSIAKVQNELGKQTREGSGHRIISYILPALNGLRRAFASAPFVFLPSDQVPSSQALAHPAPAYLRSIFASFLSSELDSPASAPSEIDRVALATLEQYESTLGLSPTIPLLAALEAQQAYWSSLLAPSPPQSTPSERWRALLRAKGKQPEQLGMPSQIAAEGGQHRALDAWRAVLKAIEEDEGEDGVDLQASDVLVASLRLAATAAVVARKLDPELLAILKSLLHPESGGVDESLQVIAAEAMQVLVSGFPAHLQPATALLRAFLLSPALRPSDDPSSYAPALSSSTRAYAALLALDSAARASAVQTLLNHLAALERGGGGGGRVRAGEEDDVASTVGAGGAWGRAEEDVAGNVVHVVALLAREIGEVQLQRLVISTLQQHAATSSPAVVCAALYELAELAAVADKDAFVEILRSVSAVARGARSSEDAVYQTAIAAYSRLATNAAKKHEELGETFLAELLTLFASKGASSDRANSEERTSTLLALVTVLEGYLTQVSFDPLSVTSSSIGALFRTFWYTCLLSGFLSPRARLSEYQRAALLAVAKRSPPLVVGIGADLIEAEAQLQAILKEPNAHALSVEAIRGELATAVPSQASAARSVPAPQAVFLATILRLESLRAEAGAFAPVFLYLGVPALSGDSPLAEAVQSIGDKVLSVFSARLSSQAPLHALDATAYSQVRAVLLHTTSSVPAVRATALRYLDNLLASFPSLVCNLGVVTVMLELLTVLRRACLDEFVDEYTPSYTFHSQRGDFTLSLTDDYPVRNRILRDLHAHVRSWLRTGLARSPLDMQGLLQEYIDVAGDSYKMAVLNDDEMGKSVALDLVKSPANAQYAALPSWGDWKADAATAFARTFAAKSFFGGEAQRGASSAGNVLDKLEDLAEQLEKHKLPLKLSELRDLFYRGAAQLVKAREPDFEVLHHVVALPIRLFTEASIAVGQETWTWIADARPELESRVVAEVLEAWAGTIEKEQGLFCRTLDTDTPLNQETQYTPTDKDELTRNYLLANRLFAPMLALLDFLSSRFQAFRYRSAELVHASLRFVLRIVDAHERWSRHPLSRELRLRLLSFGLALIQASTLDSAAEHNLRTKLYDAALGWFAMRPTWSFGNSRIQLKADLQAIEELVRLVSSDTPYHGAVTSNLDGQRVLPGRTTLSAANDHHRTRQQLVKVLLNDEADRLRLWLNPLSDAKRGAPATGEMPSAEELRKLARFAWSHWPQVVVFMPDRFKVPALTEEVVRLVRADPVAVQDCGDALAHFIGESLTVDARSKIRHLLYWTPVPVPSALRFLFPKFGGDPVLLQYALRVLEHHPVSVTFFYVPQVVQALRTDELGYAERFIFETSKISQLFCHQIIWNMKANAYRGDNAEEADPMKPKLDRVVDMIVESLSGDAQDFYNREFTFFDEVTSISGKLKPYIKASKPEKKAKIDEEMAKIKVDPGVYLPSNPDGVLVDINRKSGRPLQSHAKAPFMATFKVRRERNKVRTGDLEAQDALVDVEDAAATGGKEEYDTWQSAIFKVGDDCRQDVLALQIIAMHKNIFNSLGLDLLVTPYRVTATGPGCGVIDVIPNATSRDEMGRAKINDLQSFFVMKYGPIESPEFQKARNNFVQSMAAYSLLCYIVQIKDRHNGNIMIDGRGCITHIDFGFLFDIGPGGVKFEPSSFKLSHEMVVLMGGKDSVGFRHFRELTVKAFLAARPYAQSIVDTAALMLAAEFPSFKGEPTIDRLRLRFRLDLSEKKAAEFMVAIIDNACENKRSIVYDEFQRMTNGIPYVR